MTWGRSDNAFCVDDNFGSLDDPATIEATNDPATEVETPTTAEVAESKSIADTNECNSSNDSSSSYDSSSSSQPDQSNSTSSGPGLFSRISEWIWGSDNTSSNSTSVSDSTPASQASNSCNADSPSTISSTASDSKEKKGGTLYVMVHDTEGGYCGHAAIATVSAEDKKDVKMTSIEPAAPIAHIFCVPVPAANATDPAQDIANTTTLLLKELNEEEFQAARKRQEEIDNGVKDGTIVYAIAGENKLTRGLVSLAEASVAQNKANSDALKQTMVDPTQDQFEAVSTAPDSEKNEQKKEILSCVSAAHSVVEAALKNSDKPLTQETSDVTFTTPTTYSDKLQKTGLFQQPNDPLEISGQRVGSAYYDKKGPGTSPGMGNGDIDN